MPCVAAWLPCSQPACGSPASVRATLRCPRPAVWDSSIVLAKYFEKHPRRCAGRRCLDLSAGCGLPGLVLARLGAASVTATDLGPNLALLRKNSDANGGCERQRGWQGWAQRLNGLAWGWQQRGCPGAAECWQLARPMWRSGLC